MKAPETFTFHQNILIRAEGLIPRRSASGLLITLMQHPHKNPSSVLLNLVIRTDKDVRGSTQQRCFCLAKTRVQKLTRTSIFELAKDGRRDI